MLFRRALAMAVVGVTAMAGVTISAALPAASAQAATSSGQSATSVQLPISRYAHMLVDPVHKHIFFTSGAGSASILVTDYSGNTVATIDNEPGATGLAISADDSTVYAALVDGDAVSAISTSTLTETARYATGAGTQPAYVAYSSGRVWFGYGGTVALPSGIGSIDLSTSPATVTLNATNSLPNAWGSAPMLAVSPSGELVGAASGQSPITLQTFDISSGTATPLTWRRIDNSGSLDSLAITPDGNDVAIATVPYDQVFKLSDLSSDGTYNVTVYPNTYSPNSIAIGADGTVFAGGQNPYGDSVFAFLPGNPSAVSSLAIDPYTWLQTDGVAVTPDDSELFAVSNNLNNDGYILHIFQNPAQVASTLSLTGPVTAMHGDTVTFSGTLGGTSAETAGQVLTLTRFDPADPDGVALPTVTTAADGSFSFTDTAPKTAGQDTSTVTYQVSYAGNAHLSSSTASASVTVDNTAS